MEDDRRTTSRDGQLGLLCKSKNKRRVERVYGVGQGLLLLMGMLQTGPAGTQEAAALTCLHMCKHLQGSVEPMLTALTSALQVQADAQEVLVTSGVNT